MKKGLLLILCLGSLVQSCTKQELKGSSELAPSRFEVRDNEPSYKLQDEAGEINWYVNFDWYLPPTGEGIVRDQIFSDTNTRVTFSKGNDDNLNQMIASNTLPDIITVGNWSSFPQSASRWAVPLNVLADMYDPYFYQVAKQDTLEWYRDADGHVWGYPTGSNDYNDFLGEDSVLNGGASFLVRSDIYQAIGSPDMRTPEGFLQALRDAYAYDKTIMPLVFGIETSFSESIIEMLSDYLAINPLKNGEYNERIFDPEYLIWIKALNEAHQEGLIQDDMFTYKKAEYNDAISAGKYFAIFASTMNAIDNNLIHQHTSNPNQAYIAINGPANRQQAEPALSTSGISGWAQTFVNKNSPNKERAIQLLTYFLSHEGQVTTGMGSEGVTYTIGNDGLYYYTPRFANLRVSDPDQFVKETDLTRLWMLQDPSFFLRYTNTAIPELEQIWQWSRGKFVPLFALESTELEPRSAEDKSWTYYQEERLDRVIRMIRAKNDNEFDRELDELQKVYRSNEVQKAITMKNKKIAENIAKLNRMGYAE